MDRTLKLTEVTCVKSHSWEVAESRVRFQADTADPVILAPVPCCLSMWRAQGSRLPVCNGLALTATQSQVLGDSGTQNQINSYKEVSSKF